MQIPEKLQTHRPLEAHEGSATRKFKTASKARPSARKFKTASKAVPSAHLLATKIKARMYFGIASNDDMRQPDAKDKLRETFAAAHVPVEVEVYSDALHGWCVPDTPLQNGQPIYNNPDAERAWGKLVALYKTGLA